VTDADRGGSGAPERRSGAKRAGLNLARPFVDYFDHRFQDLHEHLDRLRVGSDLDARLEQVSAVSRQTREDVAADADTIAELAFTLERFADLFTARMDEVAETITSALSGGAASGSRIVELPFAYATASRLPVGARVATLDSADTQLPITLASLGLRVTAVGAPQPTITHPNVVAVEEPVERWTGPSEPFDAIFAMSTVAGLGLDRDPVEDLDRPMVDLFHKWLRPDGMLVLAVPYGEWSVTRHTRTYDDAHLDELLSGWQIDERRVIERVDERIWMAVELPEAKRPMRAGVALVRAAARS
jgi:hypothetical protein